jgi:hypothetical protein
MSRKCITVSALWYWGASLNGKDPDEYMSPTAVIYVVWPLAVMSMGFSYLMFCGLPDYYRQVRGPISFCFWSFRQISADTDLHLFPDPAICPEFLQDLAQAKARALVLGLGDSPKREFLRCVHPATRFRLN